MTYNGWENYHTWNVALWIQNEKPLYDRAVGYTRNNENPTYEEFRSIHIPHDYGDLTPDGVSWTDPTLDLEALDAMLDEMKETA